MNLAPVGICAAICTASAGASPVLLTWIVYAAAVPVYLLLAPLTLTASAARRTVISSLISALRPLSATA